MGNAQDSSRTKAEDVRERDAQRCPGSSVAPSVSERDSSFFGSASSTPQESESSDRSEREYVQAVLECYLWLPGTGTVTSRHDRRCARAWFRQGVALDVVRSAMVVAVARRTFRADAPLPRVRALHYFLPVVQELLESDLYLGWVQHLERKLQPLAAAKRDARHDGGGMPVSPSSAADSRESVAGVRCEPSSSCGQVGASLVFSHEPERYPEAPSPVSSHKQRRDRDEAALRRSHDATGRNRCRLADPRGQHRQ